LGPGITGFREWLEAPFPGRYEGNLGHRKEAVQDDQQKDDREVQGQHRNRLSRLRPPRTLAPLSVEQIAQRKKPRRSAAFGMIRERGQRE
jgi:hypothetical protein